MAPTKKAKDTTDKTKQTLKKTAKPAKAPPPVYNFPVVGAAAFGATFSDGKITKTMIKHNHTVVQLKQLIW